MTANNPVTDRAREAAASVVEWQQNATAEWSGKAWQFFHADLPKGIREGVWDNHDLVQAFATFERDILAGQAVPEGYVRVPVEPTEAMVEAAVGLEISPYRGVHHLDYLAAVDAPTIWSAMLAARPAGDA